LERIFIAGGAGFIGSHFSERLLALSTTKEVTAYDNLTSGSLNHLRNVTADARFKLVSGDISDLPALTKAMSGHDTVIHLASNPDIARAATDPSIDFTQGTALTQNIVEAMRLSQTPFIIYASGSGVYGEVGEQASKESDGSMHPISTYGASKLAGEALICAYAHMFNMHGLAFRFGNVVGSRQTHGVAFDFLKKLKADPSKLEILGDGTQSKSYIHVDDVIDAVFLAHELLPAARFDCFNVATGDYITVKEIAELAIRKSGIAPESVKLIFSGGDRGWKGDVPIVRINIEKIQSLGWKCRRTAKEAIAASIDAMLLGS